MFFSSSSNWLFGKADTGKPTLFCLPYAGGGASVYRNWNTHLSPLTGVVAIQLPGREERINEARYYSIVDLVDAIFEAEAEDGPWFTKKSVLFGHSMGAKIAFEIAQRLEAEGRPPALLLVSGSRPPAMPSKRHICDLDDADFDDELRHLAGTPEAILQEKELMCLLRPLLRADFAMDENYISSATLNIPIVAYAGDADDEVSEPDLSAWAKQTHSSFSSNIVPGDHFFLKKHEADFLSRLHSDLTHFLGEAS
ncbi:MAG: thioesterase [Desulfovibrionaceae bacterium]|nr:thioesterase [Desulfovibrionaceae bacterium]